METPTPGVFPIHNGFNLPNIYPYYLIVMIQMIIRNPGAVEIKNSVRKDPVLSNAFMNGDEFNTRAVLHTARFLQEYYGIEFSNLGSFTKDIYTNQPIADGNPNLDIYNKQTIALIWNYSPVVSRDQLSVKSA